MSIKKAKTITGKNKIVSKVMANIFFDKKNIYIFKNYLISYVH